MTTMVVLDKHVDGANCCLTGIVLGVTSVTIEQKSPNINTIQYLRMLPSTQ